MSTVVPPLRRATRLPARASTRRLLVAGLACMGVGMLPTACTDGPTAATATSAHTAALAFSASVAATPDVATMALTIAAADIPTPIVANLTIVNGVASGTVRMPPGAARTITAQAFDRTGAVVYEGSTTIAVRSGQNPPVAIALVGASGQVPITATLGDVSLAVTPGGAALFLGERRRLTATLRDAAGRAVTGEVTWASANPALVAVDATGLVTALAAGTADVVATFAGVAARTTITVSPHVAADYLVFESYLPNAYPVLGRIASDGTGFQQIRPRYPDGGSEMAVYTPAWSPDRSQVAFMSYAPVTNDGDLWVMNADGTGVRRVVDLEGVDWRPRWSPDGSRLLFEHGEGETLQLYTVRADGTGVTRLTTGPSANGPGAWSPDGTRIAYVTGTAAGPRLRVMNADGSDVRPLRADDVSITAAQWSPDGRRIAFVCRAGLSGPGVYVMNADGTNTLRLTDPGSATDLEPTWSPDGQWLAFVRTGTAVNGFRVIRPDGTGMRTVTVPTGTVGGFLAWR